MSSEKQYLAPPTEGDGEKLPDYQTSSPLLSPVRSRRGSESSTERSDYGNEKQQAAMAGLDMTQSGSAPPYYREFGFYHTKRMRHMILVDDATRQAVYFVDVSEFTKHVPDIRLRDVSAHPNLAAKGKDLTVEEGQSCPVVHIAKWSKLSRDMKLGLNKDATRSGQPNLDEPENLEWEDLECTSKILHAQYTLKLRDSKTSQRTPFVFERTHAKEDGLEQNMFARTVSLNSYKLTNTATNETVAIFLENIMKSWLKAGKLRIYSNNVDKSLEESITLAYCALLEKARRRANARRSNNGGSCGGGG